MSTQELQAELASRVAAFEAALEEAETFATENKLYFRISPAYGMGGTFDGELVGQAPEYEGDEDHTGWCPSSQSC